MKPPSPEKSLFWRSGQEKLVAWATVALRRGRRGQIRDGYEGEMTELPDGWNVKRGQNPK